MFKAKFTDNSLTELRLIYSSGFIICCKNRKNDARRFANGIVLKPALRRHEKLHSLYSFDQRRVQNHLLNPSSYDKTTYTSHRAIRACQVLFHFKDLE